MLPVDAQTSEYDFSVEACDAPESDLLRNPRSISTDVMADGLHPAAKGYAIWAAAVMPAFREMMGR